MHHNKTERLMTLRVIRDRTGGPQSLVDVSFSPKATRCRLRHRSPTRLRSSRSRPTVCSSSQPTRCRKRGAGFCAPTP